MLGRRRTDRVEGEFEITSVQVLDLTDGRRTERLTGRLVTGDTYGAVISRTHVTDATDPVSQAGLRVVAHWPRDHPDRAELDWGGGVWWTLAHRERSRRAAALGIDPATLDPALTVPRGSDPRAVATLWWTTGAAPLPDGTQPVSVAEAERLRAFGEAAQAEVLAIDFLRLAPDSAAPSGASLANVALQVTRQDASSYRVLARFGFATAGRRAQVGHVGAAVPVRVDPTHPDRVTLDPARLPPPG